MEKIKASPETKIEELNWSEACGNHGWFPKSLPFAQGIDIQNSSQALQCGVKNDQPNGLPWLLLPRDQDSTILTRRSTTQTFRLK